MSEKKQMYKKTGRNVTVSRDDLINAVIERLQAYDSASSRERKSMNNPYKEYIHAKVDGGKIVEIPEDIQNTAIQRWEEGKNISNIPSSHTRLLNKKRYTDNDPFIMNQNLVNTDMNNNSLKRMSCYRQKMSNVNNNISTYPSKNLRGDSQGDLPRDYNLFRGRMSNRIIDNVNYGDHPPSGTIYPNDLNDLKYPSDGNDLVYQRGTLYRNKSIIRDTNNMANNMSNVEALDPENHSEQDIRNDLYDEEADDSCSTCNDNSVYMGEDPYRYGYYNYLDDGHEGEKPEFGNNYYKSKSNEKYEHHSNELDEETDEESENEEPYEENNDYDEEEEENDDNNNENMYRNLFFLLLIMVLVVLGMNYNKNNGKIVI